MTTGSRIDQRAPSIVMSVAVSSMPTLCAISPIACTTAARAVTGTHALTGVPGWPFLSPDGKTLAVTTFDEPNARGYVELLDASDPEDSRVVEVADEPFHVLFSDDGTHLHVALANGEVPRIDVAAASITDGGYHAGGSMPEAIVAYDPPVS